MLSRVLSSFVSEPQPAAFESLEGRTLFAIPTDLDSSFSGDGKVITDFGGANDVAHAVAVQNDGKIVVAGETQITVNGAKKTAFAAVRYNADGSLDDGGSKDTTKGDKFGTGGKFTRVLDQAGATGALAVSVQKDGKILLGGNAIKSTAVGSQWYFLRLNKDGSLDTNYGTSGVQKTSYAPGQSPKLNAMVLQSDGKLVVAGSVEGTWYLRRLTTSGKFDAGFGTVTADFGGDDVATAIALDNVGNILVAGNAAGSGARHDVGIIRFTPEGLPDQTFGTQGRAVYKTDKIADNATTIATDTTSLTILANGEIYAGYSGQIRVTDPGAPTLPFGGFVHFDGAGKFVENTAAAGFPGITVANLPGNAFVFGGTTISNGKEQFYTYELAEAAFNDIDFGTIHNVCNALTVGPDGKIVEVGYTTAGGGGKNFAIARFVGTPTKSLGLIKGNVFNDLDQDGVRDSNEPGIGNMRVFIDSNNDGDAEGDRLVRTDSNGNYSLYVKPGTYTIRELYLPLVLSRPANTSGAYVVNAAAGKTYGGIDFGNFKFTAPTTGTRIVGSVYFDFNGNDFRDVMNPTEPDLPGRTVFLDLNDNRVLDANEPKSITDGGGNFKFENLTPGLYVVGDILPAGWTHTNPNGKFYIFNVGANQTREVFFGTGFADDDDTIDEVNNKPGNQSKVGGSVNFSIANVMDADLVRFTVKKGQKVGFDLDRASGSSLNSFLRLFDANGNQLATNDDAAAPGESKGSDSYLAFTFNTAGTYYIGVSNNANKSYEPRFGYGDNGAGSTGGYKLSIVGISSPALTLSKSGLASLFATHTVKPEEILA